MQIEVRRGDILEVADEAIVINIFEDVKIPRGATAVIDKALQGQITELIASGDIRGKHMETTLLYTRGVIPSKRVLVIGLGKKENFDTEKIRQVSGKAATFLRNLGIRSFTTIIHGAGTGNISVSDATTAVVEGTILSLYRCDRFKKDDEEKSKAIEKMTIIEREANKIDEIQKAVDASKILAESVVMVRDLVNFPSNEITPQRLAQKAKEISEKYGLRCQILDEADMEEIGMSAILAVAKGSANPPKFIIMEYEPDDYGETVAIVGKGITFDSGGISIKPAENMEQMKYDMAGAGAVLGTLQACSQLKPRVKIVGLIPAAENIPGPKAYKPGDIITSLSGKTIEVINTDAEGRLILADAITYALRYKPSGIIDLATLTGACVIALGHHAIGMMGNDERLKERIKKASEITGERVWELPIWEEYEEQLKSDIADIKNVGGKPAGAITGALFLKKFAENYPWVHLDIAGTAWVEKDKPYIPKGASGVGVRLLTQLFMNWRS